jgi:hypothetical protein
MLLLGATAGHAPCPNGGTHLEVPIPMLRPTILAALALATATGCSLLLPAQALNVNAIRAQNPLGGTPLAWSHAAASLPFSGGEKACTLWPIDDTLTVTATADKICIKGEINALVDPAAPTPSGMLLLESDGSGESADGQPDRIPTSRTRKVGSCLVQNQQKTVWVQSYDGCVANRGSGGHPVLTTRSTFLRVNDVRWRFDPPAAAVK